MQPPRSTSRDAGATHTEGCHACSKRRNSTFRPSQLVTLANHGTAGRTHIGMSGRPGSQILQFDALDLTLLSDQLAEPPPERCWQPPFTSTRRCSLWVLCYRPRTPGHDEPMVMLRSRRIE